uniref:Uncharacterized protein n=1 Tax=Haptolina brevifila TaxID=156173 RepID=A0A7S2NQL1_9EUKA
MQELERHATTGLTRNSSAASFTSYNGLDQPGDGAHSPRSESAYSDGRSVFSDGGSSALSSAIGRSFTGTESSVGRSACRPGSPHSASARSESQRSTGTNTTATTCREALASLRLLAQQLPPGFGQSSTEPAVIAADLRAIGVRPPSSQSAISRGERDGASRGESPASFASGAMPSHFMGRHAAISPGSSTALLSGGVSEETVSSNTAGTSHGCPCHCATPIDVNAANAHAGVCGTSGFAPISPSAPSLADGASEDGEMSRLWQTAAFAPPHQPTTSPEDVAEDRLVVRPRLWIEA